ncbi:uncharacterized protein [Spinacia oleracea]|uniref:Retrotransposon gag domain-containing protein n=1 Tax=Spinacia oleracea TaxID=3562 RepID=A0ABM3RQF5_SPIOL|nr:uncharacterized protein LOC110785964 [Spinacia oleracea]
MALPVKNLGIPGAFEATCGIQEPTTSANNFEIKPALINLVQSHPFCGKSNESPHEHLKKFEYYCDTIKHNGVTSDYVRLTLFRFSLLGRASDWLDKEVKPKSLHTWNEVTSAFLHKFYSHGKTAEIRHKIQSFEQRRDESLFEAWDRFKEYQRECPHHGIPKWLFLQTFYLGLSPSSKTSLDAGAGGPIMNKTEDQIEEIIEDVVQNYQSWHVGARDYDGKGKNDDGKGSVYAMEQARIIEKLISRLEKLESTPSQPPSPSTIPPPSATLLTKGKGKVRSYDTMPPGTSFCDNCHDYGHFPNACPLVQIVSFVDFGPSYEDNFELEYANAMNERPRYDNPNGQNFSRQAPRGSPMYGSHQGYGQGIKKNVEFEDGFKQSNTHMRMIETQLAQLANTLKEQQVHTSLPPQGQPPKKIYAITTRSGKTLDDVPRANEVSKSNGKDQEGVVESRDNDVVEEEPPTDNVGDTPIPKGATLLPLPTPKLPYPQRFLGKLLDDQFSKFLDVISKLHVTLSLTEALKQMPHYSRFMRDVLRGKRGCEPKETVQLTESCSALIQHSFPPKLNDPGSFSIPCSIQKLKFENALCDLGASVSILPYKIYEKLNLGDLSPTAMSLQLADRSLTFLVDFLVLDIDEDARTPIILGRPFLATAGALIDVQGGLITLKAGDSKASFKLPLGEGCFAKMKTCMKVETIACIESYCSHANPSNNFRVSKCDNEPSRFGGGLFSWHLMNSDVGTLFVPMGKKKTF